MDKVVIHATSLILDGVTVGPGSSIDAFSIVGQRPDGADVPVGLVIGAEAHIRSHSVVYDGSEIGTRFQTGHGVLVRESCRIGDSVSVGSHTVVEHHVNIGDGVRVHSNAFVPEFTVLEDACWLGPNVVLTNARYPRSAWTKDRLEGAVVERGAKVGANVTLLPGVRIGADALVGAGAVVTRDVEPGVVVVGNPARPVGRVVDIADYAALLMTTEEESR